MTTANSFANFVIVGERALPLPLAGRGQGVGVLPRLAQADAHTPLPTLPRKGGGALNVHARKRVWPAA